MAYCHNPNGFIDRICELRNIKRENQSNIISMDEGKKSLKLTLTLIETKKGNESVDNNEAEQETINKNFSKPKEYSVKRNFLLALVFTIIVTMPENLLTKLKYKKSYLNGPLILIFL